MPQEMMFYLKGKLGICKLVNGEVQPCDYHKNRGNSTIFKLTDNSGYVIPNSENQINHKTTPDIIKMSNLFRENCDPAGSWYLVQEQREWFQERLANIFTSGKSTPCRILIAGVASYVHYYTTLELVIEAASISQFPLENIEIDIVDKCIFPLSQIASIESNLRNNNFVLNKYYRIFEKKVKIPKENLRYLKSLQKKVRRINTRLFLRDLRQLEEIEELGRYTVITEHFLTSMLHKQKDLIAKTRKSYAKLISDGGHLLVAAGVPDEKFLTSFLEIHQRCRLWVVESSTKKVWDPYGVQRELFFNVESNNEWEIIAALDNILLEFTKS